MDAVLIVKVFPISVKTIIRCRVSGGMGRRDVSQADVVVAASKEEIDSGR